MKRRFCTYFGEELSGRLEFRTINGICAKIIQYFGRVKGEAPFSLVTENEHITKLLSDIFRKVENDYATESDLKGICVDEAQDTSKIQHEIIKLLAVF